MNCPHCKKRIPSSDTQTAYLSAENYGGQWFTMRCSGCKGVYQFQLARIVQLVKDSVRMADSDSSPDYGE